MISAICKTQAYLV